MKHQLVEKPMFSARDFLGGLLIGAAAGAAAAYLTTPQTGKKTRALLQKKGKQIQKQATDRVDDAWEQAEEVVEQALQKGQQVRDEANTRVKAIGKRGQDMFDERLDQVENILESLRSVRD
jgi:gas vesicle protein